MGQLPETGSLSIKDAAGEERSIARMVDGNVTGNKSLVTLAGTAVIPLPASMLDFRGYGGKGSALAFAPAPVSEEAWDFEAIGAENLNVTPVTTTQQSNQEQEYIEYIDYIPLPLGYENLFDVITDGETPIINHGFDSEDWMYIPLGLNNLL